MRAAWWLFIKDLSAASRSWYLWMMGIGAPCLILSVFAAAFPLQQRDASPTITQATVGVVNLDGGGVLSQRLIQALEDNRVSELISVRRLDHEHDVSRCVEKGNCHLGIVILEGFSSALRAVSDDIPVRFLAPPWNDGPGQMIRSVCETVIHRLAAPYVLRESIAHDPERSLAAQNELIEWLQRPNYDSEEIRVTQIDEKTHHFILSTMIGIIIFFMYFTAAFGAQAILKEKEAGTLQRIMTAPVSLSWIFLGKALSICVQLAIQTGVVVIVALLVFEVAPRSSIDALAALAALLVPAAGFGLLLGAVIRRLQAGAVVISVVVMLTAATGGLFTFGMTIPEALQPWTQLVPQGLTFTVWQSAYGLAEDSTHWSLAAALIYGIGLFIVGLFIQRRLLQ